ncbi:MAG: chromosome segregation protein SMC, partial [Proteobacteria bacterium]|nr:chromosome segregation protein SMC [Pseudomonadota bacterium]
VGADISRTEQQIQFARDTRERKRTDLGQSKVSLESLANQVARDEQELQAIREELARLAPEIEAAQAAERSAAVSLTAAEGSQAEWQHQWEGFNTDLGTAQQTVQVERARIEQLENQLHRLRTQRDRLAVERDGLLAQESQGQLFELGERESAARSAADTLAQALTAALGDVQRLRAEQFGLEEQIESARAERERARAEAMSVEALQRAALGRADAGATAWLRGTGLAERPRLAETLAVDAGWERAVETVLGEYLEAVCVEGLDALIDSLGGLAGTRLALLEGGAVASRGSGEGGVAARLSARVRGPAAAIEVLDTVRVADSLSEALAARRTLAPGESIVTRSGEWLGRGWLRVARGGDAHAGVIERESRLVAEAGRDTAQGRIQQAHRAHADLLGQLEAGRARAQEVTLRRERLEEESSDVAREVGVAEDTLARARAELERGLLRLAELDARRPDLEAHRERVRDDVTRTRQESQLAQLAARDLLVRGEGRRTAESAVAVGLSRAAEQRETLGARVAELEGELAGGDAPILELEGLLSGFLSRRLEVEADLTQARRTLEQADADLRGLDERRLSAEGRVGETREAMEQARLAAQETRVRRETLAEQFAATQFELPEVLQSLDADAEADSLSWETRLTETRTDIEKLGQVNLAAIDELAQSTERKEYLDRQYTDLTSALDTLEEAMGKIEKETRSRFQDTFDRINAGLQERFPRLFGGGHAYLELSGDDPLSAGVAVMARPPGKRNATISQLSGGEKALTAVALVFAIFDLNPAPFCLLDEVDAPLDENNVGRFCDVVREMAQQVQFIFITHNKATMELASQLLGVTMTEPGVSRLVAVDVDEAVRLAAS